MSAFPTTSPHMFASFASATVRILFFRAGPQDLPFEPRLTPPLAAIAAVVNGLMFAQVLPLPTAILMAMAIVAGFGVVTRALLRARQLDSRFHQTFAAVLATNAVLTLVLLPFFMQMAPMLRTLADNPALLEHPEQVKLPEGIAFVMNVLNLWSFAVTASIYRHAANVSFALGMLLALVIAIVLLFFVAFTGSLASLLFGGA
jgi:hypothetical protein